MPIKSRIRTIPHYPHQGIMFRDITTLLKDPVGLRATIHEIVSRYKGMKIDKVAGIESRGFIIGTPVAYELGLGFVPIRKKGKLPAETVGRDYELEYGTDRIEIHTDAIQKGDRVLLVDDLIATGSRRRIDPGHGRHCRGMLLRDRPAGRRRQGTPGEAGAQGVCTVRV